MVDRLVKHDKHKRPGRVSASFSVLNGGPFGETYTDITTIGAS